MKKEKGELLTKKKKKEKEKFLYGDKTDKERKDENKEYKEKSLNE